MVRVCPPTATLTCEFESAARAVRKATRPTQRDCGADLIVTACALGRTPFVRVAGTKASRLRLGLKFRSTGHEGGTTTERYSGENRTMHTTRWALVPLLGLIGCGGGGSSAPTGTVPLTTANATAVAGTAIDSSEGILSLANGGAGVFNVTAEGADTSVGSFDLAGFARQHLTDLLLPSDVARAIHTETTNCDGGGSLVQVWNDADDNNQPSPGDSFELQFTGCSDGDGSFLTGRVILDQLAISGDPSGGGFSIGMRMTFDQVQVSDGTDTATLNGSLQVFLAVTGDEVAFRLDIAVTLDGNGVAFGAGTSIALTSNTATGDYTFEADGSFTDDELGGSIVYDTTEAFRGNEAQEYASSGTMVIRGANNTSITIVVLDVQQVRLDVDSDGDGQVDDSMTVTWQQLDSASSGS